MSADCCCPRDGCDRSAISACCLPSGECEQLRECDCLEKGGKWLERLDDGTGQGTTIPAPCDRCFYCKCCVEEDLTGGLLYRGLGPPIKSPIFNDAHRCPPGSFQMAYPLDAQGNCSNSCNVPCDPEVGACCHDCGCAENVTRCQCRALVRAGGPGTQYGGGWRGQGTTCATACEVCACVNGALATYASTECSALTSASFVLQPGCASIQATDAAYYASIVQSCSQTVPPIGGGGGGGPPITPPTPPRPPQPPAPPQPCTRPPVYNPTCSYKVWFTIVTEKYEDPCNNYTREVINLYRLPDFIANSCNTLGCCGAPAPDCKDAEALTIATEIKRVTNCTFGDTDTQTGSVTLTCNSEATIQAYINPCDPCPDSRTTKVKLICATAQFLRGCCDTNMNFLQFQIPETGIKENGVWTLYYPAETVVLDLRSQVCVGYDRNHPSCKKP